MSACSQSYVWSDPYTTGLTGLGSGQLAAQTVSTAGSIATGTAPLWTQASWAIPVIGAAVAGVTLAIVAWFNRKGPKQKVATTEIANAVAAKMEENLAAYKAGPHTVSSQAQALANYDALWHYLVTNCGDSEMGTPGQRCVFERQPVGTCSQAQADAANESLSDCGKYSMARDNRDPIANDPDVKPDPILGATGELIDSVTGGLFTAATTGTGTYLLIAGLLLVAAFAFGGSK